MPRRRALTEAQLENLLALPAAEPLLVLHWTLDLTDLATVNRRRGGHNQLGFALQLCAFRYPGRLLRPGEVIPEPALRFIADQVHVTADVLAAYAVRPQTGSRHESVRIVRQAVSVRKSCVFQSIDHGGRDRPGGKNLLTNCRSIARCAGRPYRRSHGATPALPASGPAWLL